MVRWEEAYWVCGVVSSVILYYVLYSTPLLDDHKRRSISEVTNSDNIQDITDSEVSAKQTNPGAGWWLEVCIVLIIFQ